MTNPIDRIVIALDAVDGMPFGKVGKTLDRIAEDAQATKRTIEALVGALEQCTGALRLMPEAANTVFGIPGHGEMTAGLILHHADHALCLARGGA